jgi:hypothetical protein
MFAGAPTRHLGPLAAVLSCRLGPLLVRTVVHAPEAGDATERRLIGGAAGSAVANVNGTLWLLRGTSVSERNLAREFQAPLSHAGRGPSQPRGRLLWGILSAVHVHVACREFCRRCCVSLALLCAWQAAYACLLLECRGRIVGWRLVYRVHALEDCRCLQHDVMGMCSRARACQRPFAPRPAVRPGARHVALQHGSYRFAPLPLLLPLLDPRACSLSHRVQGVGEGL